MKEMLKRVEARTQKALLLVLVASSFLVIMPWLFLLFGVVTMSASSVLGSVAMTAVGVIGLQITHRLNN